VSAVLSNNAVLGTLKPGQHGSTFGGNPLPARWRARRCGCSSRKADRERGPAGRAVPRWPKEHPRQHRPRGARTRLDAGSRASPGSRGARRYCEALQARGILAKDTHDHTIRVAPPLVITSDQVDWALEQISATLMQDFS